MVLVTEIEADVSENKEHISVDVCFIDEDGKELARARTERPIPGAREGRPSHQMLAFTFEAGKVPIARPGAYRFDVLLNDRLSGSARLYFEGPMPKTAAPSNETAELLDRLPGRQKEVLHCIGKGMDNKEIAAELKLAVVTIKLYSSNLMRFFHCKNRVQLAFKARDLGA
jgi:DNA-binding CsgD family transcriptional regulator